MVIKKAHIPANVIAPIMSERFWKVGSGISFEIATAAPVLVFWML